MKKIIVLLLAAVITFGTSCTATGSGQSGGNEQNAAEGSADKFSQNVDSAPEEEPQGPALLDFSGVENGCTGLGVKYGMTPDEVRQLFPTAGEYKESDSLNAQMSMGYVKAYGSVWRATFMFNPEKGFREIILTLVTEEDFDKVAEYQGADEIFKEVSGQSVATRAAVAIMDKYANLPHEYKNLETAVYIWEFDDGTDVACRFYFSESGAAKSLVDLSNPEDMKSIQLNFGLD